MNPKEKGKNGPDILRQLEEAVSKTRVHRLGIKKLNDLKWARELAEITRIKYEPLNKKNNSLLLLNPNLIF